MPIINRHITQYFLIITIILLAGNSLLLSQETNFRGLIEQYLMPDSRSFSSIRNSFQIANYRNTEALGIMDEIENAPDIKALTTAFQRINIRLNKNPEFGPSEVQQQYLRLEESLQNSLVNSPDFHSVKLHFAYETAFFLHFYYLYYAKNSVLDLNPNFGRSVYIDLAHGKIPEALDPTAQLSNPNPEDLLNEQMLEEVDVKKQFDETLEIAKDVLPFGYYGLIPLILTFLGLIYRLFKFENKKVQNKDEQRSVILVKSEDVKSIPSQKEKNEEDFTVDELRPADKEMLNEELLVSEDVEPKIGIETGYLYAEAPHGNCFYKFDKKPSAFTTFFILQINPQKPLEASFELTKDAQELKYLIDSNFQLLQQTCEIPKGRRISSPTDILIEQSGTAFKTDKEYWQIKDKIKLA